jgi:hypothetical protein
MLRGTAPMLRAVVFAACSSAANKSAAPTSTSVRIAHVTDTTTPTPTRPRASLEFRELRYTNGSPMIVAVPAPAPAGAPDIGQTGVAACETMTSVTTKHGHRPSVTLTPVFDLRHQYRYDLGPVLLTGAGIDSASVDYDAHTVGVGSGLTWG